MPPGHIEPLTFIVGRQLALNQNVDAPTATRHGLVGAVLGMDFVGPILAQELARRDAAAAAAVPGAVTPGSEQPPPKSEDVVERLLAAFHEWTHSQTQETAALRAKSEELEAEAKRRETARVDAVKKLRDAFNEVPKKDLSAPAGPSGPDAAGDGPAGRP